MLQTTARGMEWQTRARMEEFFLAYCRMPREQVILAGVSPDDRNDWCTKVFCNTGIARPAVRKDHKAGTAMGSSS
ncbi:MAG: hypothetical protein ACFFGZ_17845 [Candidatus Thorarchaeota archaeon]